MDVPKPERRRMSGRIARTGRFGEVVLTRQAIEDLVEQMQTTPTPVNIEHDPTVPPVGRTVGGKLVELGDGECAAEHEFEIFEDLRPRCSYRSLSCSKSYPIAAIQDCARKKERWR
jgi:hypothetical protein